MTERVDFYVLESGDSAARDVLACRLAQKGFEQGLRVYIRTANQARSAEMDGLLWSFNDPSFVPHTTLDEYQSGLVKERTVLSEVLIGESSAPGDYRDMLVSLVDEVPDDADVFGRVIDLIPGDEHQKKLGRSRYRSYRDRGLVPEIHTL